MTSGARRRVLVIGGGVTGLTAAYRIRRARSDVEVAVLERRARLGGNIVTERRDGFLLDGGPDSFLRTKPEAVKLCRELGLETDLVTPREEARAVYVVSRGRLERMPGGMALAVPTRLWPMLVTPLLSPAGKLRMLGDVLRRGEPEEDESIERFITRRFGHEAAARLAAPLLGGIYAGDIAELSVRATFPQLAELEREHGSLVRGLFAAQRARAGAPPPGGGLRGARDFLRWLHREAELAPSPFQSLRGGMGSLIDELATALPPGAARTGAAARRVTREGARFRVELEGGERLDADAIVIAAPAHVAARLLDDASLASELSAIPYVSTATVFFALRRHAVSHPLDGVGFIVPPGEARILAATWVSSKWEGRAPESHALLRAFVGGAPARGSLDVKETSDDELARVAKDELERLMGPIGAPLFTRVFRYEDSNPQPVVGHLARLARITERTALVPGLYLAGAPYDGVGIPDCVRQAEHVAARVLAERC
ncbi:MAG: protoporphyrinogen oxidase [Sorangiineae bacterium]|nr:protoporphyrinogen oxidase [Polyangiaceae bacterium]MEB2323034.1 protoporphyrinogen oxidase [Sorangiineae bacterium]